ncbi:MAG: hypothetical protein ABH840_02995 [Nanoarchaeota archaeon]
MAPAFRLGNVDCTEEFPVVLAVVNLPSNHRSFADASLCSSHRYCDCQNKQGGDNDCYTYSPRCSSYSPDRCGCDDYRYSGD